MSSNRAKIFELLFDKNNNVAYKALQELIKESEETDCVYPYMDRLSDMLDNDNSYIRTRGLTLLAYNAKYKPELKDDILSALHKADISGYDNSMQPLVYKDIQKALKEIQKL